MAINLSNRGEQIPPHTLGLFDCEAHLPVLQGHRVVYLGKFEYGLQLSHFVALGWGPMLGKIAVDIFEGVVLEEHIADLVLLWSLSKGCISLIVALSLIFVVGARRLLVDIDI